MPPPAQPPVDLPLVAALSSLEAESTGKSTGRDRTGAGFVITTDADAPAFAVDLSPNDLSHLGTLTAARADRFRRGRRVLAHAISTWATEHGVNAAGIVVSARCAHCGGPHGAVRIDGAPLVASISHTGEHTIVALSDSAVAIGIDIENRDQSPERLNAIQHLTRTESADPLRHWTRVEALLKADGRGLRVDPALVRVDGHCALLDGIRYDLVDVAGPEGTVTSVAIRQPDDRLNSTSS